MNILFDLLPYLFDKMKLYIAINDDEFTTLYTGYSNNVPEELKSYKLCSVGATRNGILDIRISR